MSRAVEYRSSDAIITICQNNREKSVTISEVNDTAKELLGFSTSDLVGKHINEILPKRINELLEEYVEFEENGNDVGAVLTKVQSFSVICKNGIEKSYRVKIVRNSSTDNFQFFSLILQSIIGSRKTDSSRLNLMDGLRGQESLDSKTNLPNRKSLIKDIELMSLHYGASNMLSCFAVLQIDNYDAFLAKEGRAFCDELTKYIAQVAVRSMRPDDVVGMVGDGRIGVLLVDIARGSERLVINRLRWQIASNPYISKDKRSVGVSVSIGFCTLSGRESDKIILEKCEKALDNMDASTHNMLVDAAA